MSREQIRRRIQILTWLFILGLILAGVTAIPLPGEVDLLAKITGAKQLVEAPTSTVPPAWAIWLTKVQSAIADVDVRYPFLFYGTDWLAFGHFVIAVAFIGALRDPVRNCWLFTFGMIACALVIPYALIFGAIRGIPFWWRLLDCSFGVFGIMPLWFCKRYVARIRLSD